MDLINKIDTVSALYKNWSGSEPVSVIPMLSSGSHREYFRLSDGKQTVIGVYDEHRRENIAFLTFTEYFRSAGLPVPELYHADLEKHTYLIQDLGDLTLHQKVLDHPYPWADGSGITDIYKRVIGFLTDFQLSALKESDYSVCIPRPDFDKQSIMWDLYYFKYFCLRLFRVVYDEQALEDDFQLLAEYLSSVRGRFFMYRDFQSRNIMLFDDELYFIDYQGGRRGPLHYDLATLLFQARINMPEEIRLALLDHYLAVINKKIRIKEHDFIPVYYHFVLIRILQALATYGLRGIAGSKDTFLASIPYAIKNLEWLLSSFQFHIDLPELFQALQRLIHSGEIPAIISGNKDELVVQINSFSYKKGIPHDFSGHGGGFVFDCRSLPNPGRKEEFKRFTGLDRPVMDFMRDKKEVASFLDSIQKIIILTVNDYRQRRFNNLMINFGCTGGQHRSVYCAERLKEFLGRKSDCRIVVHHRELI